RHQGGEALAEERVRHQRPALSAAKVAPRAEDDRGRDQVGTGGRAESPAAADPGQTGPLTMRSRGWLRTSLEQPPQVEQVQETAFDLELPGQPRAREAARILGDGDDVVALGREADLCRGRTGFGLLDR